MEWLARYFARAVVRRIAYVIVALLFAAFGLGTARAQGIDYTNCFAGTADSSAEWCGDQGEARAGVAVAASVGQARCSANPFGSGACTQDGVVSKGCDHDSCTIGIMIRNAGNASAEYLRKYPIAKTCAARNANAMADAALSYTEAPSCIAGCAVQGTRFSQAMGPVKVYGMKDRTYNGEMCTSAKPTNDIGDVTKEKEEAATPKQPECTALGSGQTGCSKPNGDYCATASTGKTFCWAPAESGKKTDGTEAQVKSPKGDPVTPPPIPPADAEWQRKEGHQQTACINDTCKTYNVTNYSSVPNGTAKNSTGDNAGDGTGNTSGNGSQTGSGKGDDDKSEDSATDSGNCTVAPVCVGDTLKCLHLKFTWKTQCNTDRGEVTGGNTCADGDVPVCAGKSCKAAEYTQVLQSWRTRCGIEKDRDAAKSESDRGAADAAGDDEAGAVAKLWDKDGKPGPQLDQNKLSIGGGDLLGANIEIMGTAFTLNSQFYDAIAIIKKIIIASAMMAALWILWRS
ncbi:A coat protein [Xanthomonas campestris pv. campestris]|nr:A coat protein [Xanthomonas campestris pv. campestris]MEB1244883.1 A coat protein [Xanthomonas campestris pv. campestris]MEB1253384.1 A coat protein [Xanthomonas campestris pv. campestris]MEB1291776.1 A coat protein [Xanthomonas campestris pv. campestris]WVJ86194.1 A coat protein [Xanthomonas campestris pv. campestris]